MGVVLVKAVCDRCGKEMLFDSLESCNEYFRESEVEGVPRAFLMENYYGEPVKLCIGCSNRLYKWFETTGYRERLRKEEEYRKNLNDNNETNIEGGTQHEKESFV